MLSRMKNSLPRLLRFAAVFVCAALAFTATAHSQDWVKTVLNKSPRHQEWVKVTYGSRTVNAFVVDCMSGKALVSPPLGPKPESRSGAMTM